MDDTSPLVGQNLNIEDKESMFESSLKTSPLKKEHPKKNALKV